MIEHCWLFFFQAFASLTSWKPSLLQSHPWLTIPFEGKTKTSFDLLCDFFLLLPESCRISDDPTKSHALFEIHKKQLDEIWPVILTEHPSLSLNTHFIIEAIQPSTSTRLPASAIYFPNREAFISIILYHFAWIVICYTLKVGSQERDVLLILHTEMILLSAQFQSVCAGTGYIWATTILKGLSTMTPNQFQRHTAVYITRKWELTTGLSGLMETEYLGAQYFDDKYSEIWGSLARFEGHMSASLISSHWAAQGHARSVYIVTCKIRFYHGR